MKNGCHGNFSTFSLLDGKMAAESRKKLCVRGYHVCNDIWEAVVGETLVCIREPRNALDSYAAVGGNYSWWQNFCGFNFMVEGTHECFNTTKICAYTVCFVGVLEVVESFVRKAMLATTGLLPTNASRCCMSIPTNWWSFKCLSANFVIPLVPALGCIHRTSSEKSRWPLNFRMLH